MIDTHCHLTDPRLGDQIELVLQRARAAGVTRVITIGCEPDDDRAALELARKHSIVRCSVGMHPCYLPNARNRNEREAPDREALAAMLREFAKQPEVVAFGEIGLDRHWDREPQTLALQQTLFEFQLGLAAELGMPVVLHTREAIGESLEVLERFPQVRALFHSFTGTPDEARRITDRGYLIGFTGPVTYKKNDELRVAARECPIDQIVVETDGPYLSPEPMRSHRVNEPAFVVHTARRIAEVRGMDYAAFDEATTRNASAFFRAG